MGTLVQGFGVNDLKGTEYEKEIYTKWASMLNRCYSERYHKVQPTYVGCSVHEDWRLFSKFRSWALKQDWQGKELEIAYEIASTESDQRIAAAIVNRYENYGEDNGHSV